MANVPSHSRTRRTHRRSLGAAEVGSRQTHGYSGYEGPISGAEEVYQQIAIDEAGQVTSGMISPGAVTSAAFASTIQPVLLVHGLPTLPDPAYPEDTFVYDIDASPKSLWKNEADVWVRAIGPDDIQADSITAGQIAAGAISTSELAAGAVRIGNMADDPGGNLVTNSGFERDGVVTNAAPSGWEIVVGAAADFSVFASGTARGAYISQIVATNGQNTRMRTVAFSVEPGKRYGVGATVRGQVTNTAAAGGDIMVVWYDQTGAQISAVIVVAFTVGSSLTLVDEFGSVVAPATAVTGRVYLRTATTAATGDKVCFDDVFCYRVDRNLIHGGGDVLIDETGITIENGKFTLRDEFGETSMVASGFTGSWSDYVGTGLYNGTFAAGASGVLPVGRTASLPYWTVTKAVGNPVLVRTADSDYPGGYRVTVNFAAINDSLTLTSDPIPIVGGLPYGMAMVYAIDVAAGTLDLFWSVKFYDGDGTLLLSTANFGYSDSIVGTSPPSGIKNPLTPGIDTPLNAKTVTITMTMRERVSHHTDNHVSLGLVAVLPLTIDLDVNSEYTVAGLSTQYLFSGACFATSDSISPKVQITGDASISTDLRVDGDTYSDMGSSTTFTITNGGTATYANKKLNWVRLGHFVFFRLAFDVTGAGSGASAVAINNSGAPNPSQTGRMLGARSGSTTDWMGRYSGGTTLNLALYIGGTAVTGVDLVVASYNFEGVYYVD